MKVLELFKGSGSIGKYCSQFPDKYEVLSLDIDGKFNPDITTNILDWDYEQLPPNSFDIIWASPPCTEYSLLLQSHKHRVRDLEGADAIVRKVLDIILYFQPTYWFIENPRTGLLKTREFMNDLPFYDVSYCRYGYTYRKNTRIWTNIDGFNPLMCSRICGQIVDGKHKNNIGTNTRQNSVLSLKQRYSIPQPLLQALFECCD
jgi:hypothetical protein